MVSVAAPLLLADNDIAVVLHTPAQLDGNPLAKLKVAGAHEELSLSVTVTVKFTAVPEATYWLCDGETLTVGFAKVQTGPLFIVICTVAPVLLTAVGVMVTPAAES
jgi:hypothetical protein